MRSGASVAGLGIGTIATLLLIALILLLLGSILDGLALMLLTTPILLPIVTDLGMSAIWFGIFITRAMEIGFVHPPLGMNLYVIQGVAKDVQHRPHLQGRCAVSGQRSRPSRLLLILFPAIALWLPALLGN